MYRRNKNARLLTGGIVGASSGTTGRRGLGTEATLRTRGYLGAAPAAIDPAEHFKAVTYTGAGGTPSITGAGFQPDFVWIKNRDQADTHVITDVLRGVGKTLTSETSAIEQTDTDTVTSFDADGFSLGADVKVNTNTEDYVAWCLKAGGAGVSNTDGTMPGTVTVSANVDAGFSVVTYTGTGSVATVGHGLANAPELILGKRRTGTTSNWFVGGSILGTTETLYLNLSNQAETYTGDTIRNEVTSTTFRLGTDTNRNKSSETHVAYCFHSVPGFSKVGSYTGDGTTNNYVELGFRPAFVMIKNAGNSTNSWGMFDNARDPDNGVDKPLYADFAGAESSGTDYLQFDADGFTVINSANFVNQSGKTLIYLAFAESNTLGPPGMLTLYDRYIDTLS